MHEHPEVALNHVNEALAGLPLDVEYISFDGIRANGIPEDVKVIINCGILDSAWSGGDNWKDPSVVSAITEWVAQGGGFIGIEEPSATIYSSQYFQLSHILGVDRETGRTLSKNKYNYQPCTSHFIMEDTTETLDFGTDIDNIYVIDGKTDVLAHECGSIRVAAREFVNGRGVYASGFKFSPENTRMLFRAILWASGAEKELDCWTTDNVKTECAYFPASNKLVVINNGSDSETTIVKNSKGESINITLKPYAIEIIDA
jgi:beta-D-galactosyl-(1->4)-L-rhamnose phosphorylase